MLEDQRTDLGHLDLIVDAPLGITRQSEQHQWRAVGAGIVIALHCQHLGRLVLERVEPLRVASEDLDRRNKCGHPRSEEHTSELQSLMRTSYAVFCLKTKKNNLALNYNNS